MYKKYYYLRTVLTTLFLFLLFPLFSEEIEYINLDEKIPVWQTVVAGVVTSQPVSTSYGCVAMLDGREVVALTGDGYIFWHKPIRGKPSPYLSVTRDDFIYAVSEEKRISFYNPNGLILWEIENSEAVNADIKCGRDGRIFVPSKNSVSSYGLDGILRWKIDIEESSGLPLTELSDGSILLVMKKEVNNSSTALRISPYGEILEEITFTGRIRCLLETQYGVLMGFDNGTVGMCSVKNGSAYSAWTFPLISGLPVSFCEGNDAVCVMYQNSALVSFSFKNGKPGYILWKNYAESFECSDEVYSYFISGNYNFLSRSQTVIIQSDTGDIDWMTDLSKDNRYYCTSSGSLLQFGMDWIVSSYKIRQYVAKNQLKKTFSRKYPLTWTGKNKYAYNAREILTYYASGNYGTKEEDFIAVINRRNSELINYYMQERLLQYEMGFDWSIEDRAETVTLASSTGTSDYGSFIAEMLHKESDPTLLLAAIKASERQGFDYDGQMLAMLEEIVIKKGRLNMQLMIPVCDAVFSICRKMGKPAIFNKGKAILSRLNTNQFTSPVRDYSKQTLEKLIALQI